MLKLNYKAKPGDPDYQPNQDQGAMLSASSRLMQGTGGNKKKAEHRDKTKDDDYKKYLAEHTPWFVYDFI